MYNYTKLGPDDCEFVTIAGEEELSNGERLFVEIGDIPLVIFNIAGEIYAIGDVCTHDDGPLGDGEVEKYDVICPRHGARFDVRTGKATTLPAIVDIPAYPTRIVDGQIEVGISKDSI